MSRYIVGFLLAVGLIVVVIILIIRSLAAPSKPQTLDLARYSNTAVTMQLTIDSPITDVSTHNDVTITVGNTQTSILVTQGYDHQIVRMKTYPMSVNAYAVFLHALDLNGFTQGNNNPSLRDERGHCALGERYIYEIQNDNGNDLEHYWSTSCNTGTFHGDSLVIQQLFTNQIPDYEQIKADTSI